MDSFISILCFLITFVIGIPTSGQLPSDLATPNSVQGCSNISENSLEWTAKNFHLHSSLSLTAPSQVSKGAAWVDFNMSNPAVPYEMHCSAFSTQLDDFFYGDKLISCDGPNQDITQSSHTNASFSFSKASGTLWLYQNWLCDDGSDPNLPLYVSSFFPLLLTLVNLHRTDIFVCWNKKKKAPSGLLKALLISHSTV